MNDNLFLVRKFRDFEYRVFKPLFWFTIICFLLLGGFGLWENNFSLDSKFYMVCNSKAGCVNEYYGSDSCLNSVYRDTPLCTQEFLFYGQSFGDKPSFITANLNSIVLALLLMFLVSNTLLFNRHLLSKVDGGGIDEERDN